MVDIRDCSCHGIANGFGVVESVVSRIRPSDEEPVDPMVGAVNKAPLSQLVVARIFMKQAGEDSGRHVGADAVVRKGCTVTLSVGAPPLSPLFWIILLLGDPRGGTIH